MKIYFINSKTKNCGVYQYGLRIWDIIKESKLDISYHEIDNLNEFYNLDLNSVDILFFNWIEGGVDGPLGWYQQSTVIDIKENYGHIKTITICHTPDFNSATFDYYIDQNPLHNGFIRPLYKYDLNKPKIQHDIPHIASFGFAGDHKGFDNVIKLANEQYNEAQINLHITNAHYGDSQGVHQHRIIEELKTIPRKPGIKLNITTEFLSNDDILDFVYNNDIIILAYKIGRDSSSLPDYPISTNTPIAITNIGMFSHLYNENLDISLHTIPEILEYNKKSNYIGKLRESWSRENLLEMFESLVTMIHNSIEDTTYSQVHQDLFALTLIGRRGYFLDLGAGWDHSGINSNTLLLEENGWDGICIEGDNLSSIRRKTESKRAKVMNVYIPQTKIIDILRDNNAPKVIDYVSVDIDPMSMIALNNFPFDEYEFKVMTFEHDSYRNGPEQKNQSHSLLTEKGYICLCNDVQVPEGMGETNYFEDWWINPKYFSEEFISNNTFNQKSGKYIIENIKK